MGCGQVQKCCGRVRKRLLFGSHVGRFHIQQSIPRTIRAESAAQFFQLSNNTRHLSWQHPQGAGDAELRGMGSADGEDAFRRHLSSGCSYARTSANASRTRAGLSPVQHSLRSRPSTAGGRRAEDPRRIPAGITSILPYELKSAARGLAALLSRRQRGIGRGVFRAERYIWEAVFRRIWLRANILRQCRERVREISRFGARFR